MKLRSLALGLTLLTSGVVIGGATQQFASADVSSGDRPVFVAIDTCRITDTRPAPNTIGPKSSPLAAADTMTVDAQQTGTDCTGQIPAGATALSLNVSAINATSGSFITIWPDGERPTASSLNPSPGGLVFNAVTTELSADQTFNIYNNRGNVNVFIDVNGYYENHNHDDRYYTQTEVDAAIDAAITDSLSSVSVSYLGFSSLGSGWFPSPGFLTRGAGGPISCAEADLTVRSGATVEAVSLGYQTSAETEVLIRVRAPKPNELSADLAFNETVMTTAVLGDLSAATTRFANTDDASALTQPGTLLQVCTTGFIRLLSATVEVS